MDPDLSSCACFVIGTNIARSAAKFQGCFHWHASLIALASFACQLLRRKSLTELLGQINVRWLMELCLGGLIGSALMLIPALVLGIFGWISFQWNPIDLSALTPIVSGFGLYIFGLLLR